MCALILSLFMPRLVHRVLSQNRGGCPLCAVLYLATTVLYAVCCAVPRHHCAVLSAAPAPRHPGGRGGRVRHHCAEPCAVLSAAPAVATCACAAHSCVHFMYYVLKYSLRLAL